MKILYVNPGRIEAGLDNMIKGPPSALLAISAVVPEHDATLFDFKVDFYEEEKFRKLVENHDVVAITSMTPQIYHALEVAEIAKGFGKITIIGGYHATLVPDEVISDENVDFIVIGEGEHTFRELITCIAKTKTPIENIDEINGINEVKGISYKNGQNDIIRNKERPLEPDLDQFPMPKWELLRGKPYQYMGSRVILMETSRGCPHNCSFCCIVKMWRDDGQKLRYRKKSTKRVMQEIYKIYELKGQKWDFIFFNDDNFTIDVKRTDKILNAIIKSRMDKQFYFTCQSRVDTLTKNPWLAPKMAKAGFRQVFLGIESVHQQSLDAMGKRTNVEQIETAVKMCKENGLSIFAGMIIGFPGETTEMVRENIEFTKYLNPDIVQFTPITAFPGTPFFDEMKKNGKIATYDYKRYNLFHSMMHTDDLSSNEMYHLVGEAYAKFYFNKQYLKNLVVKAIFDRKFHWYIKISRRWIKQFAGGGLEMLHSQGINFDLIKGNIDSEKTNKWKKPTRKILIRRNKKFKLLIDQARKKGIHIRTVC